MIDSFLPVLVSDHFTTLRSKGLNYTKICNDNVMNSNV